MGSETVRCYWCEKEFSLHDVELYVWQLPDKVRPEDEDLYRPLGWPDRTTATTYCCNACHQERFGIPIEFKQMVNNAYYHRKRTTRQTKWSQ